MTIPALVVYHDGCTDGFTAAWCAWLAFPDAEFVPVVHGSEEWLKTYPLATQHVYFLDYCPPRAVLEDVCNLAEHVTVLDHHKTAVEACGDFSHPRCELIFDMDRSGAGIAWDYFHPIHEVDDDVASLIQPGETRCELVRYVEDQDLWRHQLPSSKEVSAWINSHPFDFNDWSDLAWALVEQPGEIIREGDAILRFSRQLIADAQKLATFVQIPGIGKVSLVNYSGVLVSQLLNDLAKDSPAGMAIAWCQEADGRYKYSLRSIPGVDTTLLSRQFGGGGHACASAFRSKQGPAYVLSLGVI